MSKYIFSGLLVLAMTTSFADSAFAYSECVQESIDDKNNCINAGGDRDECYEYSKKVLHGCLDLKRQNQESEAQAARANRGETGNTGNYIVMPRAQQPYLLPGMQ